MRRFLLSTVALFAVSTFLAAGEPADRRLQKPKDYNGYFPWTAPTSKESWDTRRKQVREQLLVANGLWPMPERTPLKPVIHGKIERDGYTIEKVFFASTPGHYVTGNLYRPANLKKGAKVPGVLFAHGHWQDARLSEFADKVAEAEMKSGAEKTKESAKYIFQALCQQLARMGCVVFQYDMVGNSDSKQIGHRQGFLDVDAELRLQSFMGLQTWNSLRSLDFLVSLPDVDPTRIGMTGASGGGTQTFILAALDERVTASVPAVMVSTGMQGGCICENCSYLRVGTGNIEMSGLIAPRPLAMTGAKDWTEHIEKDGLPQLKALYKLYGAEDKVDAKAWLQFGHNYNQVAREYMYAWLNRHLKLGQSEPIEEKPFVPVKPKELSVYDAEHPLPGDAANAETLRRSLTEQSNKQLDALLPASKDKLAAFRAVLGPALRSMIADDMPTAAQVEGELRNKTDAGSAVTARGRIKLVGQNESIPVAIIYPIKGWKGDTVVWVHPEGLKSALDGNNISPDAQKFIDKNLAVLAIDVFRTGATADSKQPPVNKSYAGYTFGYNRPLVAERVRDILAAVSYAKHRLRDGQVHLVGFGKAGPWVALARGLCGDAVVRTAADLNGFRFESIKSMDDELMLPGALKYGGLQTLTALTAPHELFLYNAQGAGSAQFLDAAYRSAGAEKNLTRKDGAADVDAIVGWLTR